MKPATENRRLDNTDRHSMSSVPNLFAITTPDNLNDPQLNTPKRSFSVVARSMESFLESKKVTITMSIATIYALFADDIKTLAFPKSADNVFSSLVVISLLLFALELSFSFVFKPNYRFSFYFWLDFIATLSLITDIGWIWDSLIGVSNSTSGSKQLQNAGKASRAGTRTSRVLRIIRLVRLIRLVKLYKNAQIAIQNAEADEEREVLEDNLEVLLTETKVGKKLSEVTMKRVILIVLVMLFLMPMFDTGFYYSPQTSWDFGLSDLKSMINTPAFESVKEKFIDYHKDDIRPLVYLSWANETGAYIWKEGIDINDLRYNELYYGSLDSFISIFDIRYDSKLTSLLNIFKTLYICIVLTLGALYFTKDAEQLVITPIEKMIQKVQKIAENPVAAAELKPNSENLLIPVEKSCFCCTNNASKNTHAEYETNLIENTIIKIGILLALGFGEAGASIIGSNVKKNEELDPMLAGNKIVGIFGFCDIRNFTDTTEELKEGVMVFVNEIAQIIHGIVDKYFGAANKNIGDAFLLVWKFSEDDFFIENDRVTKNEHSLKADYVPDMSLMAFLKILVKTNKDPSLLKYRTNQRLLSRMPNYEVKLGFGLHLGWAIEGPIGSQFKVDCSYLSPHVNLASALEGSTKVYGVPLLLSGSIYNFLSSAVKKYCRLIDVISIKGMSQPVQIYTSDCDFSGIQPGKIGGRKKEVFRKKRKALMKKLEKGKITGEGVFRESNEVQAVKKGFSKEFYQEFKAGIDAYLKGDWLMAKVRLEKVLAIRSGDGPALSILEYIKGFGFKSPETWKNHRFLS